MTDRWQSCSVRRFVIAAGAILVVLLCPLPISAAGDPTMTLTVTLNDVDGAALPNVRVRVVAADSAETLAEATTDARGTVQVAGLVPREVRIIVEGRARSGTTLRQIGQDADGIRARLPTRDWALQLVADHDGVVFPDLISAGAVDGLDATAIAAERVDGPSDASPAAPPAPTPAALAGGHGAERGPMVAPAASNSTAAPLWQGIGILIGVVGLGVALLAMRERL